MDVSYIYILQYIIYQDLITNRWLQSLDFWPQRETNEILILNSDICSEKQIKKIQVRIKIFCKFKKLFKSNFSKRILTSTVFISLRIKQKKMSLEFVGTLLNCALVFNCLKSTFLQEEE